MTFFPPSKYIYYNYTAIQILHTKVSLLDEYNSDCDNCFIMSSVIWRSFVKSEGITLMIIAMS